MASCEIPELHGGLARWENHQLNMGIFKNALFDYRRVSFVSSSFSNPKKRCGKSSIYIAPLPENGGMKASKVWKCLERCHAPHGKSM